MSSFKLWEIPQAIDDVAEYLVDPETGEMLTEEEARELLDKLEIEKDNKVEYLAKLVKNYTAEANALREQKKVFDARIKSAERRADSIKNYLKFALQGEKWKAEDASISVSYRNTKDVVKVISLDGVPDEWYKPYDYCEKNLDKTKIKKALKEGETIAGIELEDRQSVIIK